MPVRSPSAPKVFRTAVVAVSVAIIGTFVLIAAALVQERDNRIAAAREQAENTSQLVAGYMLQIIQKIDMVTLDVQEHVRPADMRARRGQDARRTEELHRMLARKLSMIPEGSVLHLSNARGDHIYSSLAVVPDINIADRYHFLRQKEDADAGLVISPPLISRTTGKWAFVATRRLNFEDGSFAGVVNFIINLDDVAKFFASLDVMGHGVVNMRDREMRLMVRSPAADSELGKAVSNHPAMTYLRRGIDHAVYQAPGSVDGVMRLYSFRQVGDFGLYVFAGVADEDYLSEWRRNIMVYGVVSFILTVVVFLMLYTVRRNLIERELALAKLAREEEKFHTIADYTYDWEYWEGVNHEILFMSPSCERITGYSPDEFKSVPDLLHRIIHPDDQHLMADHTHDAAHADTGGLDFRIVRRDGETRWIAHGCRAVFGRDGQFMGRRSSNRDITERKQAEDTVRHLNEELEQRVESRTALLEAANKELEDFSYSMSHSMYIPLRAIDGFSKMLLEEYDDKLDDDGKRMLGVVRDNARRMTNQIDGILSFIRMSKLAMEYGPIDIGKLARDIFVEMQAANPARRMRLVMGEMPVAWGDREMVRQVLMHLLSNALKFSPADAEAAIELSCTAGEAENIYAVKDHGVGFDMQYVNKLFKVFERVHPTGQYEGAAIGLAIVKRIVARHGGRVWAQGDVGAGATFSFSLPREERKHSLSA